VDGLVITADDFGLAPEVNEAVELAHRAGVLRAASLMVTGTAATHAIRLARRMPKLRVGLHLVLVEGIPALPESQIPELVDETGRLRSTMVALAGELALRPNVRRQLALEIGAQFTAFRKSGLNLDHVNAHKHFHVHPMVANEIISIGSSFRMMALRVPREPFTSATMPVRLIMAPWLTSLRARARRAGLLVPDWVFGLRWSGRLTAGRFRGLLAQLPRGLVEIYTHPATSDSFAGHVSGYGYTAELAALTDRSVIECVARSGYRTGGYSDFGAS
jgi:hopanoid biosynthesis associated protein HpnK